MVAATREAVLLEWRPLPTTFDKRERAIARLAATSALLQVRRPQAMRTLDCPGYAVDRRGGRAALVYRLPPEAAREDAPLSLLRLLTDGCGDAAQYRPTLDDRFALSLALAETVFRLHMSGWLHRSVGAHNVLFFVEAGTGGRGAVLRGGGLRRPFLSGFEFSRDEEDSMFTDTVVETASVQRYRHPGCQGQLRGEYKKIHDLYR